MVLYRVQLVFTVMLINDEDEGVIEALNGVASEIMNIAGGLFEFTPFVRFGR